jgi:hypothetical protein
MKKVNQLESLKPKGISHSATQNRRIEQKCIETSMVFAEDIDDDSVFTEIVKNDKVQSLLLSNENNNQHLHALKEGGSTPKRASEGAIQNS